MRGMCALLLAVAGHSFAASHEVAGLEQPSEILVDAWGVPHIYARTHYDAFFVQGFNAARDRLWQIDLWRRRGLGQLSEVLGARSVEQDRANRLFLYRGYKPAGLFPRRTNHDGLLPVPGDGRYEWQGFFDMDALPEEYNPPRGFIATANANTLPADYPVAARRVGFEWAAPWRQRRLVDLLQRAAGHRMEDSLTLQRDYASLLAREVLAALPHGTFLDGWDGVLAAESAPAALFSVWYHRHLVPALAGWVLGDQDAVSSIDSLVVPELLRRPEAGSLIAETLDAAHAEGGRPVMAHRPPAT